VDAAEPTRQQTATKTRTAGEARISAALPTPESLTARVLALQRQAGNHAVARVMGGGPRLSRMSFARFQTLGRLSNWGSYSAAEQRLLDLEQELTEVLATIKPWMAAQRPAVAGAQTRAQTALTTANAAPLTERRYAAIERELETSLDNLNRRVRGATYDVLNDTFYAPDHQIARAGGDAQKAKLAELAVLAGKDKTRLEPLLLLAAGNARTFDRLYRLTLRFPTAVQPLPPRPQPPSAVPYGYPAGVNMDHFLHRHTYDWFDFTDIKAQQAFWPPGTTGAAVSGYLEEALQVLHPQAWYRMARTYAPFQDVPPFRIPSGFTVKVGFSMAAGQKRIGQFFPMADARVEMIPRNEMNAIRAVLGR
jgi:hypothetical protein